MKHIVESSDGNGITDAEWIEFRPDDKGRFDEIVARKPDMVHVETMTGKSVYIGFYWDDGRYCQFWINSKKKLQYHHAHGRTEPARLDNGDQHE